MTDESAVWAQQSGSDPGAAQLRLDEAEDRRTLQKIGLVVVGVTLLTVTLLSAALVLS